MFRVGSFGTMALALSATLTLCGGCDQQEAQEALEQVEASAGEAAETIKTEVGEAVEEGEKMASEAVEEGKEVAGKAVEEGKELASELSEKATAYLAPLKDKLGNLGELKDKPEELKAAVSELIESMEAKAEDLQLPESVSNALATIKEKLVALRDYLEGEVEQAQLDTRLEEVTNAVKSGLGMSTDAQ